MALIINLVIKGDEGLISEELDVDVLVPSLHRRRFRVVKGQVIIMIDAGTLKGVTIFFVNFGDLDGGFFLNAGFDFVG